MPHPIDIFRTGRHTAMSGLTLDFSETDLDATIAAYDPALHEAPIVVGHPAHDAPAYGWVHALARVGEILQATPAQVDPAFAELVENGRFKKISASFYAPDAPSNPSPGVYYLRHVGFLGAQPPAVKGLREASFAASEDGVLTLEFGDWTHQESLSLWRRLREFIIEQFGAEKAEAVIPSYSLESLEADAREPLQEAISPDASAFSENSMTQKTQGGEQPPSDQTQREADLDARLAEIEARESRLKEAERTSRNRACSEFAEQLVAQGRVLPRDRDGLVAFLAVQDEAQTLEFGEGEDAYKGASVEWLRQFLSALPVQVDFAERSAPEREAQTLPQSFRAPSDTQVDPQRMRLHAAALAYQEGHVGTSYADAVTIVSQQSGA